MIQIDFIRVGLIVVAVTTAKGLTQDGAARRLINTLNKRYEDK